MSRIRDLASILTASSVLGTDVEITTAVSDHSASSDPHTGYVLESLIDAKGDLIVGSADNTVAKLSTGNSGESIVADSSTSTGLRYQTIQTRNCLYNSGFDVWQRGTSFTASGYTADRWYAINSGIAGRTVSRQAGTGQFQYVTRIQRTAANTATNGLDFGQSLEIADATPFAGKTVTLSFYARKGANFSGDLGVYVFSGTSSTEANRVTTAYASGGATAGTITPTLTTTLQRFQVSFTFGATVTQFCVLFSNNWSGTAGAADYYDVTGVQLEMASIATEYVRQSGSIQGELAACHRYYYQIGPGAAYASFGIGGFHPANNSFMFIVNTPVVMRVVPTFTTLGNFQTNGTGVSLTGLGFNGTYSNSASYNGQASCSGATTGYGSTIRNTDDTTAKMMFSSEL